MYSAYSGFRPRVQLWHGDSDETINPNNFSEAIKQWTNILGLDIQPSSTTTVTLSGKSWTRQSWQSTCGFTVLDAWLEKGGIHNIDANLNAQYVVPFLGLDNAGDADPQVATCTGGAGTGGASGSGGSGGSGAGGASAGNNASAGRDVGGAGAVGSAGAAFAGGPVAQGGSSGAGGNATSGGAVGTAGAIGSTITGGATSAGGSAAAGASSEQNPSASGCSCAVQGSSRRPVGTIAATLALALASCLRRRRSFGNQPDNSRE
jgi:hypothetical protein